MKPILVALIFGIVPATTFGMRCGNSLITDGDPLYKLVEVCGKPDAQAMNTLYYKRDKMVYTVHYDQKQIITYIEENIEM